MTETQEKEKEISPKVDESSKEVSPETTSPRTRAPRKRAGSSHSSSGGGRAPRKRRERRETGKSEFDQKIISIRRVTRVSSGGRRFSFSVAMVIGDRNGRVGVGIGKASDTALAIEKAIRDAKDTMITVKRTKENSIPHETEAKYCSSLLRMMPSSGKGLVAGSSVRTILELAGVTDVSAKLLSRSKNKLNNARATIKALKKFS